MSNNKNPQARAQSKARKNVNIRIDQALADAKRLENMIAAQEQALYFLKEIPGTPENRAVVEDALNEGIQLLEQQYILNVVNAFGVVRPKSAAAPLSQAAPVVDSPQASDTPALSIVREVPAGDGSAEFEAEAALTADLCEVALTPPDEAPRHDYSNDAENTVIC